MKNWWNIVTVIVILTIIAVAVLIRKDKTPDENFKSLKTNTYDKININWKDYVDVEIGGLIGESYVKLSYKELPELKKRQSLETQWFEDNRIRIIDEMTDSERVHLENRKNGVAKLGNGTCLIEGDSTKLSNGDKVIIRCGNEWLEALGYSYKDTMEYEVKDLKEKIAQVETQTQENEEPIVEPIDFTTAGNTYYLHDNTYWIVPEDPTQYVFEEEYNAKDVYVQVHSEDEFNIVKEKAKTYDIDIILYDGYMYTRETNFLVREDFRGVD